MLYLHFLSCGNTSMFVYLAKLPTGEPHYFTQLHIRCHKKKLLVLFTEYTVSRNHYLICSQMFSPKQTFIYISMHKNQCKCCSPLQSLHLKNRYVALFTHTHTHTPHSSGRALPECASISPLHVSCSETMNLTRSYNHFLPAALRSNESPWSISQIYFRIQAVFHLLPTPVGAHPYDVAAGIQNKNDKVLRLHATKPHSGSGSVALPILNLDS
jgi:hypothetical protein